MKIKLLVPVLFLFFLGFNSNSAQQKSIEPTLFWLNAGLGGGTQKTTTREIGASLKTNRMLYNLNFAVTDSASDWLFTPHRTKKYYDLSLQIGTGFDNKDWHISLSGGFSFLTQVITTNIFAHTGSFFPKKIGENVDKQNALGFKASVHVFYKFGKVVGMGFHVYVNANRFETISGIILSFILGKLY